MWKDFRTGVRFSSSPPRKMPVFIEIQALFYFFLLNNTELKSTWQKRPQILRREVWHQTQTNRHQNKYNYTSYILWLLTNIDYNVPQYCNDCPQYAKNKAYLRNIPFYPCVTSENQCIKKCTYECKDHCERQITHNFLLLNLLLEHLTSRIETQLF